VRCHGWGILFRVGVRLGQPPAIAVAGGPRHHLHHGLAFPGEQKAVLIFEALEAARRDVVLDRCRGGVRLWFSGEAFSHFGFPVELS